MNNALAGVGSPIKDDVCRVSMLNLANRYPEANVIRKPKKGKYHRVRELYSV